MKLTLFDTTLRDGAQTAGISFSVADKLKILSLLDDLGIDMIEGGWPGSNPKDEEFFRRAAELQLKHARLVAFGSTRKAGGNAKDDPNLRALLAAETDVVSLVGKSSLFHVREVLRTTPEENLRMIEESVSWMKTHGRAVAYDGEHFFDAWHEDSDYAMATLRAAAAGGADWFVLCDTNGGAMPWQVADVVELVRAEFDGLLGIHAHNDAAMAVANSLTAVKHGCAMVQGTINGYGERCGNANLMSILPTLQLKMGLDCVSSSKLSGMVSLARQVSEIANCALPASEPYVGTSAFTHKGGIHVAAVERVAASYEHVEPTVIGNQRRISVSELSGRANVRALTSTLGLHLSEDPAVVVECVKELEGRGFHFEGAEASFALLVERGRDEYTPPFRVSDFGVHSEQREGDLRWSESTLRIRVDDAEQHVAASGVGPVHALDRAFRKALEHSFPMVNDFRLTDFKVRILDGELATAATTRVLVEATNGSERWTTVGCSQDIVDASFLALVDSYEFFISNVHETSRPNQLGYRSEGEFHETD